MVVVLGCKVSVVYVEEEVRPQTMSRVISGTSLQGAWTIFLLSARRQLTTSSE